MKQIILLCLLLTPLPASWAFSWHDLWITQNHQAERLMHDGDFKQAQKIFTDPDWQATAAFRAKDFKFSADRYASLKPTADTHYNEGNALAHGGQLEAAMKAYDKALALSPTHEDALFNRKIVEKLLKQQKEKQDQDKQNQDKQKQDKQDQNKQNQDKQNQDKQNQDKQDQDKQDQDKQDQDQQDQDQQDQDKQDQNKQDQNKQDQNKQDQNKQDQNKQDQEKQKKTQAPSQTERENQEAQEQWLRLIPDDPGGLMREKFLRDHLRRTDKEPYE